MRPKESYIALKDLPSPELRIFGQTSGVTNIYGNGAVIVETSIGHGYFPSHRELVNRLGQDYAQLISSVEKGFQIRDSVGKTVADALDALPITDQSAQPEIRDLRARRHPLNSAPLTEVVAPSPFYTVEPAKTRRRVRATTMLAAAVATL